MSIFNGAHPPLELLKYEYRKLFHLSSKQLSEEPIDALYLNLEISSMLNKKRNAEMKYAGK